jgi:DNA-binding NarL/FixJ family response regulator
MRCGSARLAVMMIYNPDRPRVERTDVIAQIHGLSTQESALVCAIAAGESLEDIATESKRSLEAVRSQLKRVFRKTGTSRQTELVKLVLSGPAAMVQ